MSDYFLGEVRMFAGTYAPQDFALCNGSLLTMQQYAALFSLIGTTFGGNGVTNFGIPDLRSRVPVGQGQGTNLTARVLGQSGGFEGVALSTADIPAHTHTMMATTNTANVQSPAGAYLGTLASGSAQFLPNTTAAGAQLRPMSNTVVANNTSTNTTHNNVMPSLPISYVICTQGLYPTRPN